MSKDQTCDLNLLKELNLEDDMIGRKNAVQKYMARHMPKYLVDIVLQFLGTRDYSLITKPKFTIKSANLLYPYGVSYNSQKLMAVGYYRGEVAIWDIRSQKLIRWRRFGSTISAVLSFRSLWVVGFWKRSKILILDSELEEKAIIWPKDAGNCEGIAICERRGWIAISDRFSSDVKIFELDIIEKSKLRPTAVMKIEGLRWPAGICFNLEGTVLAVTERHLNRISLVNPLDGQKLLSFGSEHLICPNDVKLDTDGNFLVYDTGNRRLCIFDQEGTFLLSVLDGFFRDTGNTFSAICVASSGTIAVSDNDNQQVFIF